MPNSGNRRNNRVMKKLFAFTGILAVAGIFWASLGFLLDLPSFRVSLPLALAGILLFLGSGILKNREEQRRFREFLESQERDRDVQEKLKNEQLEAGDKTGRAKVKAQYRERNTGLNWTGASVHGAVPHRKKRRTFLPKNR